VAEKKRAEEDKKKEQEANKAKTFGPSTAEVSQTETTRREQQSGIDAITPFLTHLLCGGWLHHRTAKDKNKAISNNPFHVKAEVLELDDPTSMACLSQDPLLKFSFNAV
jgi:hypothetical protein